MSNQLTNSPRILWTVFTLFDQCNSNKKQERESPWHQIIISTGQRSWYENENWIRKALLLKPCVTLVSLQRSLTVPLDIKHLLWGRNHWMPWEWCRLETSWTEKAHNSCSYHTDQCRSGKGGQPLCLPTNKELRRWSVCPITGDGCHHLKPGITYKSFRPSFPNVCCLSLLNKSWKCPKNAP